MESRSNRLCFRVRSHQIDDIRRISEEHNLSFNQVARELIKVGLRNEDQIFEEEDDGNTS